MNYFRGNNQNGRLSSRFDTEDFLGQLVATAAAAVVTAAVIAAVVVTAATEKNNDDEEDPDPAFITEYISQASHLFSPH